MLRLFFRKNVLNMRIHSKYNKLFLQFSLVDDDTMEWIPEPPIHAMNITKYDYAKKGVTPERIL